MSYFEKVFKLEEFNTNVKTEMLAGLTTFMTMAYILAVNPFMLSETGMDIGAVFTATALASLVGTLVMAFYANLPFALAPGMGLNAFFVYTVVFQMGYSWQFALTAVLLEGIIFIILTIFNVREAIINCIPTNVKKAISVGIGLFIAFIGFTNAGLIIQGQGVPLMLGDLTSPQSIVAVFGLILIGILLSKNVKGALFFGIVGATIVAIPLGVTSIPSLDAFSGVPSLKPILFQFEFDKIFTIDMLIVLFTFLFVDMFDTVGTLIGVSEKAGMIDENGKIPRVKEALMADAIATTFGAMVGTSTVTTYVESASGVSEGGRTGLTALTTAFLFFLALFFAPIFLMIPGSATAPALIIVGLFMMSPIKSIDFEDYTEAIPAFLTIILMPLSYSISDGIIFGMLSYVILKVLSGRQKEVPAITYVIAFLFIIKILFV
ncbi:MAG: NCS2 family permease [Bacillota bacterium]|nr:NCS2 family permease [Bacillota bacterium]